MNTSLHELGLLGPPVEDLETRRLRQQAARALFEEDAPNLMRIGRFEIEGEIGSGGQGAVYLVHDPKLDRKVALKRLAIATPSHMERMRREALALAQVSHDNVVKVFEIDEDETGRPFLVMELVEGSTLDDWLARQRRGWKDVLDVFIAIGEGLAAIHAVGLVHRDVKPSNIVIAIDGRAKLVDLGIAATDDELGPASSSKPSPGPVGTWGYMAPEQLDGRPSPKSDQLAFCVTLYEALHGVRPPIGFDGRRPHRAPGTPAPTPAAGPGETTAKTAPTVPSWGPVAKGAQRAPKRLRLVLARGLSPNPEDRYPEMPALVAELRRIRNRSTRWPVTALAVAVVAALGIAMLRSEPEGPCAQSAPATALWQGTHRASVQAAFEATDAPDAARAFTTVDAMLDASTRALDQRLAEACDIDDDPTARELALARILEQHGLLRSLADSLAHVDAEALPETPSRLATLLGRSSGDHRDACELGAPSEPSPEITAAEAAIQRATAEAVAGHYDAALELAADALSRAEGHALAPYRARLHLVRGRLALDARRLELARAELEQARSLAETLDCDGLGAEALALWGKAQMLDPQPDVGASDHAAKQALEKLDSLDDHAGPRRAEALNSRGLVLRKQQRYPEAIASFEDAIAIRESLVPPAMLDVSDGYLNVALVQADQGHADEAIETLTHALRLREQALWPDHPSLYRLYASLSYRHLERGDLDASEQALTRALELAGNLGDDHPRVAQLHIAMARLLDRRQEFERALQHARQADAILTALHGENAPQRIATLEAIGQVSLDSGWPDRAIPAFERALEIQAAAGSAPLDLAIGRGKLAHAHANAGHHETAILLFDQAQRAFADPSLHRDAYYPELQLRHGESLVAMGREDEAVENLRLAERWWEERADNPERLAIARWGLARALCPQGTRTEHARQALAYFRSVETAGARQMRSMIAEWLEQPCPRSDRAGRAPSEAQASDVRRPTNDEDRTAFEENADGL